MATLSHSLSRDSGGPPSAAPDELAALQLERGGLSLKPLSLLMVLLLWQALAVLNGSLQFYNPKLFPAPSDIAVAGWTLIQTGDLQRDIAVSVGRVVVGFAIAAPLAILLG